MHAAGVFGDVATDRTGNLRRRIGRVVQVKGRGGLGNRQVAHPRLHPCRAGDRVDGEDLVEARHHQQHAFLQRQGAARQAGAGTARDHRHLAGKTQLEDALDLFEGMRQYHQHRRGAVGRKAIAFVGLEVFLGVEDIEIRQL
ncbi:hypothetical protein D3C76_1461320 [compost metagenome]